MDITTKLTIRDDLVDSDPRAVDYVAYMIRNPDEGSEFDLLTKTLRSKITDDQRLIKTLGKAGYDVMIGYNSENIVGHMAFQEHNGKQERNWQMFHLYVDPKYRGKDIATELAKGLIDQARNYEVQNVRLGAGGHPIMAKVIKRLQKLHGKNLNIESNPQSHWINLKP